MRRSFSDLAAVAARIVAKQKARARTAKLRPPSRLTPPLTSKEAERFWGKVSKPSPDACWLWTASIDSKGYGTFKLRRRTWKAHRVAAAITRPYPVGTLVCHRCDEPRCCNPAHLFWGSQSDNMADCAAKGRLARQQGRRRAGMAWNYRRTPVGTPVGTTEKTAQVQPLTD